MSAEQPNIPPTRVATESKKSESDTTEEAIKSIYAIFSAYNGLIRKIIDLTTPVGGKWSTRRSNDNSTVMYFASVLKGLNEPIKHLMFQLGKVRDANLASMFQMVYSLQQVIDQSPPFKMIDIAAYKQGIPNYEGLSDDLTLTHSEQYLSLLEIRAKGLDKKIKEANVGVRPTFGNIPKEKQAALLKELKQTADEAVKNAKDQKDALDKEIAKTKKRINAGLGNIAINQMILDDAAAAQEAIDTMYDLTPEQYQSFAREQYDQGQMVAPQQLFDIAGNDMTAMFRQNNPSIVKNRQILKTLKQRQKDIEGVYPNYKDAEGAFDAKQLKPRDKDEYLQLLNNIARMEDIVSDSKSSESATAPKLSSTKEGLEGVGKIQVDNTQQYNSMGRPLSNDQKINNDMINANRNWQVKNNPPHDTPLGNLNPFLAQDKSAKYTYEVELAKQNATLHPQRNALGADISLLQGPIGGMSGSGKSSKAMMKLKKVAIDERNDQYAPTEMGTDGFIPEDQENQFKLPDLKPKKKK